MLVNLNKNKWLHKWMEDTWRMEVLTIFEEVAGDDFPFIPDVKTLNKRLASLLTSKGYRSRATSSNNIIIIMKDEEFTFLALKYMGST